MIGAAVLLLVLLVGWRVRRARKVRSAAALAAPTTVLATVTADGVRRPASPRSRWAGSRGFM